ncbi:MAG: amidase family protein [Pseudomonadota bacterium]
MHRRDLLRLLALGGLAAVTGCGGKQRGVSVQSIADLDCIDQHDLVITGELTAQELVAAAIDRIDAVNKQLNAVVTRDDDRALLRAQVAEGALAGVPYLLKDLNPYRDMRTTFGSALYRDRIAIEQTPYTDRIDESGLVVLGKTNTPEFGLLPSTSPKLHGPTRNPWNPDHTPGGSSGGAAAAVASRMVPAAQASDGGGSIRIPAAQCGLFGLKPSIGRFPDQGHSAQAWPISVKHALTRSVRDSALILALTEQTEGGPLLPVGFVTRERTKPLRIALSLTTASGPAAPEIADAIRATARVLTTLGHEIIETEATPHANAELAGHLFTLWGAGVFPIVQQIAEESGGDVLATGLLEPATITLAERYGKLPSSAMDNALAFFSLYQREVAEFFEEYDAWLSPVTGTTAPEIGYLDPALDFDLLSERVTEFASFTATHNVAGTPAMSVPAGRSETGLPIGAQLSTAIDGDATLLQLAYQLEEATPWRDALPPVHA